jgi:acetyl esterase
VPSRLADRELQEWLDSQPPFSEPDVLALRAARAERDRGRPRGPELEEVVDLELGAIPVRLYVPAAASGALLVHLHGGGWTIGSIESHDRLCRRLAVGAEVRVLSVGYRLAPEHPWPAAVDDAVAVLSWVAQRPAALRAAVRTIAVCGDSAGGALATLACLRLRDRDPAALPAAQILLSPNTDLAADTESMREKGRGFTPDARLVHWFNAQWVPDPAHWSDPGVSPLRAADLTGLPRALVVSAEHDPLRDEAEAYARRLAQAGVTTTLRRELGLVHNPVMLADVSPACTAALDRVIADVRRMVTAPD